MRKVAKQLVAAGLNGGRRKQSWCWLQRVKRMNGGEQAGCCKSCKVQKRFVKCFLEVTVRVLMPGQAQVMLKNAFGMASSTSGVLLRWLGRKCQRRQRSKWRSQTRSPQREVVPMSWNLLSCPSARQQPPVNPPPEAESLPRSRWWSLLSFPSAWHLLPASRAYLLLLRLQDLRQPSSQVLRLLRRGCQRLQGSHLCLLPKFCTRSPSSWKQAKLSFRIICTNWLMRVTNGSASGHCRPMKFCR